jgi:peptidyl-prolyl cis-trans isomerase B (cyclophilin B)
MRPIAATVLTAALLLLAAAACAQPFVRLSTDAGTILLALTPETAPHHVANFTHLCRTGFYNGTTFHRVIPGFMIQGGDPNSKDADRANDGQGGPLWKDVLTAAELAKLTSDPAAIKAKGYTPGGGQAQLNAEFNATHHARGVLSMARSSDPNSAGSQFFICVADVSHLDGKYTAFGKVVTGLDTVDAIVKSPRDRADNPLKAQHIIEAKVIDDVAGLTTAERTAWEALRRGASAPAAVTR